MDLEGLDSCSVCMESFDENFRPRTLPCGHTFCTVCITRGIKDGNIECANCKVRHQALRANDFGVSYTLEALISKIRESKQAEENDSEDEKSSESESVSICTDVIVSELLENVRDVLEGTKTTEAEAEGLRAFLCKRKSIHRDLIKIISNMVQDNENVIKELDKDDAKVVRFLKEGEKYRKEVSSIMQKVNNATEDSEISSSIEDLERLHDMLVGWNMRCKKQLPLIGSLKESRKIITKTTASLRQYNEDVEDNTDNIDFSDISLSITDKKTIFEKKVNLSIMNKILTSRKTNFSKLAVCAVQKIKGSVYNAALSFEDGRTYVHCLEKFKPPANALVIQYDELTKSLNKDSVVAFMDLAWEGSIKGRIHILLSPQTPITTHFWKLCTGEMGFGYLNNGFLRLYMERNNKYIVGGSISPNSGKLQVDYQNCYPLKAGSVSTSNNLSNFEITLERSGFSPYVFGQIQEGIEIVSEAAKLDQVNKVRIEDCGIVMPRTLCCF